MAKSSSAKAPVFPGTLARARHIYLASYQGDQFDQSLLPDDREAIRTMQDAIKK
jgi:hypothetical protein